MLIPFEIRKIQNPDGTKNVKAVISIQYALSNKNMDTIKIIEELFIKLIKSCKKQIKVIQESRKNKANTKLHWELGDMICKFMKETEKRGLYLAFMQKALVRHIGLSERYWGYHIQLRNYYRDKELINDKIKWSLYQELLDIADINSRNILEKKLLSGEIKNRDELRKMKKNIWIKKQLI